MFKYTVAYDTDTEILRRLAAVRIVVCNNSEQVIELVENILKEIGFTKIRTANNAFEAVKFLKKEEVHLLIADSELRIPKKDNVMDGNVVDEKEMQTLSGYSFVTRVRHAKGSPNRFIPILMLLDESDPDQLTKARDAGITEVLPHPLEAKKLFKKMIDIIEHPREFITAEKYKGPCRRLTKGNPPEGTQERRKLDIKVIEYRKDDRL